MSRVRTSGLQLDSLHEVFPLHCTSECTEEQNSAQIYLILGNKSASGADKWTDMRRPKVALAQAGTETQFLLCVLTIVCCKNFFCCSLSLSIPPAQLG